MKRLLSLVVAFALVAPVSAEIRIGLLGLKARPGERLSTYLIDSLPELDSGYSLRLLHSRNLSPPLLELIRK